MKSPLFSNPTGSYQNFNVAIYATVYDVQQMADLEWLKASFRVITRHLKVDKVYLETHRDAVVAEQATLTRAREFFAEQGVQTSGGITWTVNERNHFQTYCYTNPEHRQKVKEVVEYTARLFDELILDDFFFTNCKCASCIKAKGDRSWTEFRLALMAEAAENLIVGPAKAVNPKIKTIVKYPNWYEHFQGLGFNLEAEPPVFDGIYTGTETRDPTFGHQHLQPYHGYSIFRYFENIKPGGNCGGWVDPFGSRYLDRYAEQLWLTLYAKAPEVTLFNYTQVLGPIQPSHRAAWQGHQADGNGAGFDFDAMVALVEKDDDSISPTSLLPPQFGIFAARRRGGVEGANDKLLPPGMTFAAAAGCAFAQIDGVLTHLGQPVGVKGYRPYHATGEDFLHSYLGMLGIPIDIRPEFPTDAQTILLTESAKFDADIVGKIEQQVAAGKTVVVTSGLYKALQGRGIRDIVELDVTDHPVGVQDFQMGWFMTARAAEPILIPHINYLTNDSWEIVSAVTQTTGHPMLHEADYGGGRLVVLTIPHDFNDLYKLPVEVLSRIRATLMQDLYVQVDGPAQVMLFVYEADAEHPTDTFIIESFLPEPVDLRIVVGNASAVLHDVVTGEVLRDAEDIVDWRGQSTGKHSFLATLKPHSYRVFCLGK